MSGFRALRRPLLCADRRLVVLSKPQPRWCKHDQPRLTADEEGEQACRGSVSYRSRDALGLIQRIGLARKLA